MSARVMTRVLIASLMCTNACVFGLRLRPHMSSVSISKFTLDLPSCRYTSPADRRGWRGVREQGEDPEKWYDSLGERNGPPRNFVVQSREERYHTAAVEIVTTLIGDPGDVLPLLATTEDRMSIRQPLLNKKLFGTWAPVLLEGKVVASLVASDEPKAISCVITTDEKLHVPATLTVRRDGERITTTNGYGTTDAHLKPGEPIRLTLAAGGGGVSEAVVGALEANERTTVPWQSTSTTKEEGDQPMLRGGLQLGCVSLLDEYLLVQRDAGGELLDVWLRCDNEPLQLEQADLYSDLSRAKYYGKTRAPSRPGMS
jgi:hypothetical protein